MRFDNEIITSRNNKLVKWFSSLQDKKYRNIEGYFLAEGVKLTAEAFDAGLPVEYCIVNEEKKDAVISAFSDYFEDEKYAECRVITVSNGVFEKISTEKAPQGIISVIKHLDFFREMDIIYKEEFFLEEGERAIFLHSVRDPLNLGAVIRSAVAFGVDRIVLTDDCVDVYNPKTVRSAMGSLFKVRINVVSDLSEFIKALKAAGRRVFAAELRDGAISLAEAALTTSDTVIIGNEGHGIPVEISSLCTGSVYIPISGKTESLNASVAASIFIWEQSKSK